MKEFSRFGEVNSIQLVSRQESVMNPKTLKHSALVVMKNRNDALDAITDLHRKETLGGPLLVKEARSRAFRDQDAKLFVGMLPVELEEHGLRQLFSTFGIVEEAVVMRIRGHSRGCGWVRMKTVQSCEMAIMSLNGQLALRTDTAHPCLFVDFSRARCG